MRLRVIAVLTLLTASLTVWPAKANFHLTSIVEVFPGTAASPDAQYVVLQAYASGQNVVNAHPVRFYDATGAVVATFTFAGDVPNGANQSKILIATSQAQAFFGVTPDLVMTSAAIRVQGGKICFDTIDCVAWGNYSPVEASVGTPFARAVGLTPGQAVRRNISAGNPALLEGTDDTNNSAVDFLYGAPAPRNNLNQSGAVPASTCQNGVLEGLEDCDDGNAVADDMCNATCSLTRLFADGLETGDLSRWHAAVTDAGDLAAAGDAALAGSFGLRGVVDDQNPIYVQNDLPSSENRYRARFYFHPNGFDPGESGGARRLRVFIGFQRTPMRRLLAIVLRRLNNQYSVLARARRDDDSFADSGFFDITDGAHWIEFDWRRSSGPGLANGSLRLWIDGVLKSTVNGIDNDSGGVDLVRLGAQSVKPTASGTIYWDQFDSRRETFIGP